MDLKFQIKEGDAKFVNISLYGDAELVVRIAAAIEDALTYNEEIE